MRGNIMIFSITDLLGNFSRRLVFPYVSLYILALGGDAAQIGFISALAPLAGLIMFPLGGYIADHANRVRLIILANSLAVAALMAKATSPNWQVFAIAGLIQGFIVIQFPAKSSLIADDLAPEDRGKGIAAMNTISTTLAIFAPYLAGIIVENLGANTGIRVLYFIMIAFYSVITFVHFRYLKENETHASTNFAVAELPKILRDAYKGIPAMLKELPLSLKALAGVIVLNFMTNGVASPFWVVYVVNEIGLSPSSWGFILLLETVLKLLLFMPAGLLVDRWGRTTSLLLSLIIGTISIPAFVLVDNFYGVLIVRLAIAVSFAIAIPACTALMADTVPRPIRGRVMAALGQGGIQIAPAGGGTGGPAVGFLITIPLMISSLAGGYLYTLNPTYPWLFVFVAMVISVFLTILFIRDPKSAEV